MVSRFSVQRPDHKRVGLIMKLTLLKPDLFASGHAHGHLLIEGIGGGLFREVRKANGNGRGMSKGTRRAKGSPMRV